jgi:hypothetical protein
MSKMDLTWLPSADLSGWHSPPTVYAFAVNEFANVLDVDPALVFFSSASGDPPVTLFSVIHVPHDRTMLSDDANLTVSSVCAPNRAVTDSTFDTARHWCQQLPSLCLLQHVVNPSALHALILEFGEGVVAQTLQHACILGFGEGVVAQICGRCWLDWHVS